MASTKRFVSNMGFYALGTFATKLLQFLFVPIYSKFIDPSDMGTYNVILATVAFAIPLLFQSIWEGSFRFTIEQGDDGRKVLATSSRYCMMLSALYTVSFLIVSYALNLQYGLFILLYALGQVGTSYWQFAARALKANKAYAMSTVINSSIAIVLNLILILVFRMGITALFVANIAGAFVMVLFLETRLHLLADISRYPFNKELLLQIIKYSIPLAINLISWWLMSSCNSIIISSTLGTAQNGIYAIALKFGTILSIVTTIITLAWQEEAFRNYGEKDQDVYFNKVLNILVKGLLGSTLFIIPITYILYKYFVFGEYREGVILVGFIYLSAVYNALSCHLGSAFLARKESGIMFYTTLSGGIINVLVAMLLVQYVGIIGAVIGTLLGNMFNFYIRIPLLYKRISLTINYHSLISLTILCLAVTYVCIVCKTNITQLMIISLFTLLLGLSVNKQLLATIINKLRNNNGAISNDNSAGL